jgi:pentatricopeptide repeat protein
LKSLFHCLRLLVFGIQIATYGKITDYSEANHYWEDMWDKNIVPSHKWEDYKAMYQPELNRLKSEFIKLCPKPM